MAVFLCTLLVPFQTTHAQTTTQDVPLTEDTYVNSSGATNNYSTRASIQIQGGGGTNQIGYVSAGTPIAGATSAVLYFSVATAGSGTISVRPTTYLPDTTITWNNRPPSDGAVLASNAATATGWVTFDVTSAYQQGVTSFALTSDGSSATGYRSLQTTTSGGAPFLRVTTAGGSTPTAVNTPTSTPIPATSTPTNTAVPATNTPTNTAIPATATAQPTATQVPNTTCTTVAVSTDTYVNKGAPNTNYGTNVSIRVEAPVTKTGLITLPNYDIGTGTQVVSAKLRLWVTTSGNGTVLLYDTDANFNEATVTWNTQPGFSNPIAMASGAASGWVEFDVKSYYLGGGRNLSLLASSDNTTAIVYRSSDSASGAKPELVLCTTGPTPVPPTSTPIPPTSTPVPPTSTPTSTNTPVPSTSTPVPATATNTAVPATATTVPSTATNTPVPSTATNTPAPATATNTAVPPTATPTGGTNVTLPARAFFYYGWYPESWNQMGVNPWTRYEPTLGYYASDDPAVAAQHVSEMLYANGNVAIASWWGSDHWTDAHLPTLLNAARPTSLKVALLYEEEGFGNPTQAVLTSDLNYINTTYGSDSAVAKINGRIVIYVYNADDTTCGVVDKWKAANTINAYLVMKVFSGYASCPNQPDAWYQYGPASRVQNFAPDSYTVSAGFWRLDEASPRLPRDPAAFAADVQSMIASGADWQLITTYNEWGEGSGVESTTQFGNTYLDILHNNGLGGTPTPTAVPTATKTPSPTTPTATPSAGSITFYAVGDIMTSGSISTSPTSSYYRANKVGELVQGAPVVLLLGDNQYQTGEYTLYQSRFDVSSWGTRKDEGVLYPTAGNHEYDDPNGNAQGYYQYFGSRAGDPTKGYYSFDQGGVNFIVLNSNCGDIAAGCSATGPQGVFLTQTLQAHPNSCNIITAHHPRFGSGQHGNYSGIDPLWKIAVANGADVALMGHDHVYERLAPMNGSGAADPNGMREFVVGTGGVSFYGFVNVLPTSQARITNQAGALRVTVDGMTYTWEFVTINGEILDSGTGTCK